MCACAVDIFLEYALIRIGCCFFFKFVLCNYGVKTSQVHVGPARLGVFDVHVWCVWCLCV